MMSLGSVILMILAVLIYGGVLQRVLDRLHLTDRAALLLVGAMLVGTFLPNIRVGIVSLGIGGAVIPLGVCLWLLMKADTGLERARTLLGCVVTGAAVYALSMILPDEPETMLIDPMWLSGLAAGIVAYILGRSRRGAFVCGVVGVTLADCVTGIVNWSQGINQQLVLGGAGMMDASVFAGVIGVALTELVGESLEKIARASEKRGGGQG